jgi:hypothetical protein
VVSCGADRIFDRLARIESSRLAASSVSYPYALVEFFERHAAQHQKRMTSITPEALLPACASCAALAR